MFFVEKMNKKAQELGMNDTVFKNCHGIDEDGHVTSSYDISIMSRELLKNHPDITKYTTIWMDSLRDGKSELVNTNKLIKNYQGATGLKTGSTSLALFNLSASATRDGLSLIAVVMRAPTTKDRFSCAKKLLDYGFTTYQYKEFSKKDDFVTDVLINKGKENTVGVRFSDSFGMMCQKNDKLDVEQEIIIDKNISAPINKDQVVGKVIFKSGDNILGEANLLANEK